MAQQPKRVKYRKVHRGRRRGSAQAGDTMNFGDYGLQALESAWITGEQIEAGRRAITRHIRRGGKVWIRIFPDKPVSKKPAETRMGSGKGVPDHWVAVVRAGRVMFEMAGVGEKVAREAMRLASHKLPIKTRFMVREATAAVGGDSAKVFPEFRDLHRYVVQWSLPRIGTAPRAPLSRIKKNSDGHVGMFFGDVDR